MSFRVCSLIWYAEDYYVWVNICHFFMLLHLLFHLISFIFIPVAFEALSKDKKSREKIEHKRKKKQSTHSVWLLGPFEWSNFSFSEWISKCLLLTAEWSISNNGLIRFIESNLFLKLVIMMNKLLLKFNFLLSTVLTFNLKYEKVRSPKKEDGNSNY